MSSGRKAEGFAASAVAAADCQVEARKYFCLPECRALVDQSRRVTGPPGRKAPAVRDANFLERLFVRRGRVSGAYGWQTRLVEARAVLKAGPEVARDVVNKPNDRHALVYVPAAVRDTFRDILGRVVLVQGCVRGVDLEEARVGRQHCPKCPAHVPGCLDRRGCVDARERSREQRGSRDKAHGLVH